MLPNARKACKKQYLPSAEADNIWISHQKHPGPMDITTREPLGMESVKYGISNVGL